MSVWDCHIHLMGGETAPEILSQMDEGGITRATLMSRFPADFREMCPPVSREAQREAIDHVAGLQAADHDRVWGLYWVDPRTEGILAEVEYALGDRGLHGIKMIPDHWTACDEFLFPLYEKVRELGKVIQFHSGILYAFGDSSRFCRPVLFEGLLNFPGLKFSLAHIGWPWVDECLAVFGHFNSAAAHRDSPSQMWIDTCRGTPDAWRLEALQKSAAFCGTSRMMFGTDLTPPNLGKLAPVHWRKDMDLLRNQLGLGEAQLEEFFWGAAEAFYAGT
jgi:uncharacterized protein